MILNLYNALILLGLLGKVISFPATINEFYHALHDRLIPVTSTGIDKCQIIAYKKVVSYEEAINCYTGIPLKESVRYYTLQTIRKTMKSYVYRDILTKSPDDHIPSSKDIDAELEEINRFKFSSEFKFNSFLHGYFNTLNDGHTRYVSNCYNKFKFRQPFPIHIVGSEVRILERIIHSEELMKKWSDLGIDVTKYEGSLVLKINDMDPLEYFKLYLQFYIGIYRDINSRLNYGFTRVVLEEGDWGITHGAFSNTTLVPIYSSIRYSLETSDGKTHNIDVPYLVESPEEFNDTTSFYKKYCQSNGKKKSDEKEKSNGLILSASVTKSLFVPISQPLIKSRRSKRDLTLEFKLKGPGLQAYLVGNNTGVLVVSDFITGEEDWDDSFVNIFKIFKNSRVKNLILSLSNNPGGYACRLVKLLNTLFEDAKMFPMDQKIYPIQKILCKSSLLVGDDIVNPFSHLLYRELDGSRIVFFEGFMGTRNYTRGYKKNVPFTPKYLLPCPADALTREFKPKNIAIVTNGLCYSACGFLVKSLQQLYKIPTYLFGGDVSLPAQPGSGLGGVMDFDNLFALMRYATKRDDLPYFHSLPKHVRFAFSHDEAYSHLHTDRPLEFVYLPADNHLPNDKKTMVHPAYLWSYIAREMNDPNSEYHLVPVKIN